MSDYREERRRDQAAAADQRRQDAAAVEERRAQRQRAADERAARLRDQGREDRAKARQMRQTARTERAARRSQALTAGNVYRKGTLALVTASALGSLPAQVLHFVHISPMLLPLPLALEGAAWVMAAGVAFADERHLPGWVRWLLRGLVIAAAGFAASINYGYGLSLADRGLSAPDAATAGLGLAAVTLLGPLLFEIRQWVTTLSAAAADDGRRQQRRHAGLRRRHHRGVAKLARRLLSAAPYGSLSAEDAWSRAWQIVYGTADLGMTPDLHRRAVQSATALAAARHPSPDDIRTRLTTGVRTLDWVLPTGADVVPIRLASSQVAAQIPPAAAHPGKRPAKRPTPPRRRKGDTPRYSTAARVAAADTARRTATVTSRAN